MKLRKYKINKMYLNKRNVLTIENITTKKCVVYYNTLSKIL